MGVVTIKVYDEVQQAHQKFFCEVNILLASMRYFKSHMKNVSSAKDFEISVYCDISVFAWLLCYVKTSRGANAPELSNQNVLAILISSNFLQMEQLVSQSISKIAENFYALLVAKTDLASLADDLLQRIAKELSEEQLEKALDDPPNEDVEVAKGAEGRASVLVNKLYKMKLEHLLRASKTTVFKCSRCGWLFSAAHSSLLQCSERKGTGKALHEMDRTWRFRKHVQGLRAQQDSWRSIFWHVWGVVTVLYCFTCEHYFSASQYSHCTSAKPPTPTGAGMHQILPDKGQKLPPGMELDHSSVHSCIHHLDSKWDVIGTHAPVIPEDKRPSSPSSPPSQLQPLQDQAPLSDASRENVAHGPDTESKRGLLGDSEDGSESETCPGGKDGKGCGGDAGVGGIGKGGTIEGSYLSTVGGLQLSVQDLGLSDVSAMGEAWRLQLLQEDDSRRMESLAAVLSSMREKPPSKAKIPPSSPPKASRENNRPGSARPSSSRGGRPASGSSISSRKRDAFI